MENQPRKPSFAVSLTIILFLFAILVAQVVVTGSPNIRMTLIFASAFAAFLLLVTGTKWKTVEEGILHGCQISAMPNIIMILIGTTVNMNGLPYAVANIIKAIVIIVALAIQREKNV